VEALARRGRGASISLIQESATRLERLAARLERQSPIARVVRAEGEVERSMSRLGAAMGARVAAADRRLAPAARALEAVSPLAVLERGYSITRRADGRVVEDPAELEPGEELTTIVARGEVDATVRAVRVQERGSEDG
jgi:exodeoxyribonuclease VII large subunit